MINRTLRAAAVIAAIPALAVTPVPAQAADPPLQITMVYVNTPGNDRPVTNAKVNAEYVRVKNNTRRTKILTGFSIVDEANHTFVFPRGSKLRAGATVNVHTGKGTNSAAKLFWKQGYYVWNNDGDKATLRNTRKAALDSCSWKAVNSYVIC